MERTSDVYGNRRSLIQGSAFDWVLSAALLAISVCIFVPFSPTMPDSGLDPSWVFGMNQAVAQGLSFGKEMIFTFGPYASIFTRAYHPATDFMMIGGSAYFAISLWCALTKLARGPYRVLILLPFGLSAAIWSPSDLLFAYPLVVAIVVLRAAQSSNDRFSASTRDHLSTAVLFSTFGLLILVKGTLLILCGAISIVCFVSFLLRRQGTLAAISILTPFGASLLFWCVAGQSIEAFPYYFISSIPIIFGYTEAMSLSGRSSEIYLYVAAAGLLLTGIAVQRSLSLSARGFIFLTYSIFLFLAFKGGFVRHDGHAMLAGTGILVAALLLPFVIRGQVVWPIVALAITTFWHIDSHHRNASKAWQLRQVYWSALTGLARRVDDPNWPESDFRTAIRRIAEKTGIPKLTGTSDIYSYQQSSLIASQNIWSPRPVLQSYSVYTKSLAEINKAHLLSSQGPSNIIFRVEPIDGRIPASEDGASWPVLLDRYRPVTNAADYLLLQRGQEDGLLNRGAAEVRTTRTLGETVDLPVTNKLIFAHIDIQSTLLGRAANALFKTSELEIAVELQNGTKRTYRIVSGMARSGFLLSPLVENTTEFMLLYADNRYLAQKAVRKFTIYPRTGSRLWQHQYTVSLSEIERANPLDLRQLMKFEEPVPGIEQPVALTDACEGFIDSVNNRAPSNSEIAVTGTLRLNGWLATSIKQGSLPEKVFLVLTDVNGKRTFINTRRVPRLDVGSHFRDEKLNDSGFAALADITQLDGVFKLGLAVKNGERTDICSQFNYPIRIEKW